MKCSKRTHRYVVTLGVVTSSILAVILPDKAIVVVTISTVVNIFWVWDEVE